jgi:RNA polymerase sigma-70 factor (ECF subfamily)
VIGMSEGQTTAIVQRYLNQLAEDAPAEPTVRAILEQSAQRLQRLCANLLYRSYSRLTRPPLNLQPDEVLGGVVERLLKALRAVHPETVRQFFAMANQHLRWELNDLARRLDEQPVDAELQEGLILAPQSSDAALGPGARQMLQAIEDLPADEREVFDLVRIQEMSQVEVATLLGIATRTVQRRLNRALLLLAEKLSEVGDPFTKD